MRARNLKPGFFKNEALAQLPPLDRLLFAGLWGMADREGRLEDRPKRIKVEVLPYDDCDVEAMLCTLDSAGFIIHYRIGAEAYIQVVNFMKHQNPHHREVPSTIPPPKKAQPRHGLAPGSAQPRHGLGTTQARPSPADSPFPLPHSLNPESKKSAREAKPVDNELVDELMSLATSVKSATAEWEPSKADRATLAALASTFPPEQLRREMGKFTAYAPQRDYKLFGKAFASWMGRVTPDPMTAPRPTARKQRITNALAQWDASRDEDLARVMCQPDEWEEVKRQHQIPTNDFAGIDFGEEEAPK